MVPEVSGRGTGSDPSRLLSPLRPEGRRHVLVCEWTSIMHRSRGTAAKKCGRGSRPCRPPETNFRPSGPSRPPHSSVLVSHSGGRPSSLWTGWEPRLAKRSTQATTRWVSLPVWTPRWVRRLHGNRVLFAEYTPDESPRQSLLRPAPPGKSLTGTGTLRPSVTQDGYTGEEEGVRRSRGPAGEWCERPPGQEPPREQVPDDEGHHQE